jgi:hypothetical protein
MSSLKTILSKVGKDLKDVGVWVENALKLVAPAIAIVDPAIGPYITEIEAAISAWEAINGTISAANAEAIATAVSTLKALGLPTPTTATKVST